MRCTIPTINGRKDGTLTTAILEGFCTAMPPFNVGEKSAAEFKAEVSFSFSLFNPAAASAVWLENIPAVPDTPLPLPSTALLHVSAAAELLHVSSVFPPCTAFNSSLRFWLGRCSERLSQCCSRVRSGAAAAPRTAEAASATSSLAASLLGLIAPPVSCIAPSLLDLIVLLLSCTASSLLSWHAGPAAGECMLFTTCACGDTTAGGDLTDIVPSGRADNSGGISALDWVVGDCGTWTVASVGWEEVAKGAASVGGVVWGGAMGGNATSSVIGDVGADTKSCALVLKRTIIITDNSVNHNSLTQVKLVALYTTWQKPFTYTSTKQNIK